MAARCPRCGKGALFRGFLTVAERCDHCGLNLADQDTGDGPAVFLSFILGTIALPFGLLLHFYAGLSLWATLVLVTLLVLGLTLGSLRPVKAYVIGLNYRHRRDGA